MACFLPKTSQPLPPSSITVPQSEVKLTQYSSGLGCACKIRAQLLDKLVASSSSNIKDLNLLVGTETGDDASVQQINDDIAIISTTDFFPPIVDDAETYGSISATNALSDIYAMGGRPIQAISIVGFPINKLPIETLEHILSGAQAKVNEAGISISGGHSINTAEPIFGLSVSGIINPKNILRNIGIKDGDYIILTKSIGTGIVTSALKRGANICPDETKKYALNLMQQLNAHPSEVIVKAASGSTNIENISIHALTDITGFGLSGHLKKMVDGSNINIKNDEEKLIATIFMDSVPIIPGVSQLLNQRGLTIYSSSSISNIEYSSPSTIFSPSVQHHQRLLLFDAQTSGGLLVSVGGGKDAALKLVEEIKKNIPDPFNADVRIIGQVNKKSTYQINEVTDSVVVLLNDSELNTNGKPTSFERAFVKIQPSGIKIVESIPAGQTLPIQSVPTVTLSTVTIQTNPHVDQTLVWLYKNSIVTLSNDVLGKMLIVGMMKKGLENSNIPSLMIFMGDAVELTTINKDTIEILQEYERIGVIIWSCITCLTVLKLVDKVRVGRVAQAPEIVSILASADKRITTMS